jgi:hypothetical protein
MHTPCNTRQHSHKNSGNLLAVQNGDVWPLGRPPHASAEVLRNALPAVAMELMSGVQEA